MTLHGDEADHLPENQSTEGSDEVVVIPIGKAMFRCAIAAAIGSVPGIIVISLGGHRAGVMLVAFGLFIGAAMELFRWVFGVDIENPRRWLVLSGESNLNAASLSYVDQPIDILEQ